jgi:hypothetical protein
MKRLDECERIEFCWVLCEWSHFVTFKTCGATPRTPFSHWDMRFPAQSQKHARLSDVLLQLCPSLPNLRNSFAVLFGRFIGTTAQSTSPARACLHYGSAPSQTGLHKQMKAHWRSPGSRACCFPGVRGFLDYAGPDSHSRVSQPPYCLPRLGIESAS